MTKDEVVEFLSGLSVLEVADLVRTLEEKWGVSAAAPVAVAAAGAADEHLGNSCRRAQKHDSPGQNLPLFAIGIRPVRLIQIFQALPARRVQVLIFRLCNIMCFYKPAKFA